MNTPQIIFQQIDTNMAKYLCQSDIYQSYSCSIEKFYVIVLSNLTNFLT